MKQIHLLSASYNYVERINITMQLVLEHTHAQRAPKPKANHKNERGSTCPIFVEGKHLDLLSFLLKSQEDQT